MDIYDYNDVKVVVISAVVVLNITMNGLVIALLARYPALRQDRTALFVFSLCLSDLACGCTALPISAAVCSQATPSVRLNPPWFLPEIQMFCIWWFGFNSQHSLTWVALSKLIAIAKPLRSQELLTRRRCYGIIAFNWIVGAVLAASKFSIYDTWSISVCTGQAPVNNTHASALILSTYVVTTITPNVVLIVATVMMFVIVLRTHRRISTQVLSIGGDSAPVNQVTVQTIRSAKNIIIICLMSMALTFPMLLLAVLLHFFGGEELAESFSFSAVWLYNSNSFMNSFLYLVLYRSVREKCMDMFANVRDCFSGN